MKQTKTRREQEKEREQQEQAQEEQDEGKIIFLVKETHKHDDFYEDDTGTEYHTFRGKTTIETTETTLDKAKELYDRILDANADNPPYDEYEIISIFWKNSKEIIPREYFNYDAKKRAEQEKAEQEYYEAQAQQQQEDISESERLEDNTERENELSELDAHARG